MFSCLDVAFYKLTFSLIPCNKTTTVHMKQAIVHVNYAEQHQLFVLDKKKKGFSELISEKYMRRSVDFGRRPVVGLLHQTCFINTVNWLN